MTLQVVGFEQDFHRRAVCAFTIYIPQLADVDPEVVSLERIDHEVFEEANVERYADSFTSLSQHAMDPAASRKMIERIRRELTPAAH